MLDLRGGHNAAFGGYASAAVQTLLCIYQDLSIKGGAQYSTIGKTSLGLRPEYAFATDWGYISAEALIDYTNLSSVNSLSIGAGTHMSGKWIDFRLGYYYHLFGGKGGSIVEPFNVYYELAANLLPMQEDWDLQLIITNCDLFELERHFQPSFIAQGLHYLHNGLGLSMGIGCKPAGMFNMSADNYQSYLKLGVLYRW